MTAAEVAVPVPAAVLERLTAAQRAELAEVGRAAVLARAAALRTGRECPAWCERLPDDHGADPTLGTVIHRRHVGTLGVELVWCPTDAKAPSPVVYLPPDTTAGTESVSVAVARELGAALIEAADLIG